MAHCLLTSEGEEVEDGGGEGEDGGGMETQTLMER